MAWMNYNEMTSQPFTIAAQKNWNTIVAAHYCYIPIKDLLCLSKFEAQILVLNSR